MAIGVYPIPPPDPTSLDKILSEPTNQPLPEPKLMAIFDLLECIINHPPPRLEHKSFSPEFTDFIDKCLKKEPNERADLKTLLVPIHFGHFSMVVSFKIILNLFKIKDHPWIKKYENENVDIAGWVCSTMNLPPATPN